jgi:hypothetical protein
MLSARMIFAFVDAFMRVSVVVGLNFNALTQNKDRKNMK